MKFKYKLTYFLLIFLSGIVVFFSPIKLNNNLLQIKFQYMAYACGDCYTQYKIKKIYSSDISLNEYLENDISIVFSSSEQETSIKKQCEKCMICCDFYFTGYLKRSFFKGIYFKVEKAEVDINEECCFN